VVVPAPPELVPGHRVGGKYEIVRHLGSGGFADVYLAHDQGLDKDVAVKFLKTRDLAPGIDPDKAKRRFIREARELSKVDDHPNIVRVIAVDEEAGVPYFVMDYLPDGSLGDLLRKGPLPPKRAATLVADVASALVAVHRTQTVHRDIKPANIFLKGPRAVLGDFGIAFVPQETRLTSSTGMPGTPMYMSPETLRREPIDTRADLFSLGCVLYEALSGEVLFMAASLPEVVGRIMSAEEANLEPLRPRLPEPLLAVLKRSLAKKLPDRYESAAAMERDLRGFVAATEEAEARLRVLKRRRRLAVAVAVLVPLGGLGWLLTRPRPTPPRTAGELLADGRTKAEEAWQATGPVKVRLLNEAIALFSATIDAAPDMAEAWFERGMTRQLLSEDVGLPASSRVEQHSLAAQDVDHACRTAPQQSAWCEMARRLGSAP
jgi:serine/threonine protein kinase